ncbi:hypothetical protein LguiB_016134 [Lonicera macranthoides]
MWMGRPSTMRNRATNHPDWQSAWMGRPSTMRNPATNLLRYKFDWASRGKGNQEIGRNSARNKP